MGSDEPYKGADPDIPKGKALSGDQGQSADDTPASGPQIDASDPGSSSTVQDSSPLGSTAQTESHIGDVQGQVQHGLPEEPRVPLRPDETGADASHSQVTSPPVAGDSSDAHGHEPFPEGQFAEEQDLEIDVRHAS